MDMESGTERQRIEPNLDEILARGRERGFVTVEEVNETAESAGDRQEVIRFLRNAGVEVIDTEATPSDAPSLTGPSARAKAQPANRPSIPPGEAVFSKRLPYRETAEFDNELMASPVAIYLREIDRVALLTAAQEVALAKRIAAGRQAAARLQQPVRAHERKRLTDLVADGERARRHMTEANLRLVVSVAKKYTGRGMPLLDLIQEGNLGLNRAIDHFDYTRGFRFSTYAHWWIRQAVTRSIADQSRTIRVPVHVIDLITAFFRAQHELEQKLGREPTIEEVAEEMGTTPERIREIVRASRRPISLEAPLGAEDEERLADLVPDRSGAGPAEEAALGTLRDHMAQAMAGLTDRERTVLRLRFGLGDGRDRTLAEIAAELGVSRERARQLEADALRKLRQPELRQRLKEYLEE